MDSRIRHVHHSYIWLGGIRGALIALVAILVGSAGTLAPLAIELAEGASGAEVIFALPLVFAGSIVSIVLILGLSVLFYWLSWKYLTYEISGEEFSVHSGIFSKKHSHVPFQRIQSVDIRASLLQRIAGVCSVEIDTAGGSANKAIMVPYITKTEATYLKAELFRRKHLAVGSGSASVQTKLEDAPVSSNVLDGVQEAIDSARGVFDRDDFVDEEPIKYKTGLTNRELLFSGLSGANGSVGVVLFAIITFACTIGIVDFLADGIGGYLDTYFEAGAESGVTVPSLVSQLALRVLPYVVGACILSYVLTLVVSALAALVSYGGFQVRRRGSRIEVERGLLQRQTQGIDVDRVQLLRVEQGWIRRLIGYCKVSVGRIDSISGEESNGGQASLEVNQGIVVHPFLKVNQLEPFISNLIPELQCQCKAKCQPQRRALRRAVLRNALWHNWGFWALVIALVSYVGSMVSAHLQGFVDQELFSSVAAILLPILIVFVIVMCVGAVNGVLWLHGSSLEYGGGFVRIVNEGLTREEVVIPRQKVQFGALRANPFQLVGNFRSVEVTTAAGAGGTSELIWDIEVEDAGAFIDWLRPRS